MTHRVSPADLNHAFDRAKRAAEAVGIDTSRWTMQTGSATYGRAYRLYERDPHTGGLSNLFGYDGYLGMTRRETQASLDAMARAWWAVVYVRDQHAAGAR